jgi:hypothetical protein
VGLVWISIGVVFLIPNKIRVQNLENIMLL